MSGIAQNELRKLSSRIKFGHQQAIKKNVVLGNSRIFGYNKQDKRLVIDESEAVMIRELYELYATNEYSMKQLETLFWNKGYKNRNGNKIAHSAMSGIISNPKYKGYYVGNKVKVVDMFTKKQKFLPPEEWVMFKDETGEIVPVIVSEELWDKANIVLQKRSDDVKSRQGICNHANLLTGKLFCTDCGLPYYRRESKDKQGNKNSKWVCSGKINNGSESCASFTIYEEEIKPLLLEVFRETAVDAEALIEEYIKMYKSLNEDGRIQKSITELQRQVDVATKKKNKLLEYNVTGRLSDNDFIAMNAQSAEEIEVAEREIFELKEQQNSEVELKKHIDTIRRVLKEAENDAVQGVISKAFIDKYIDKIFVTPVDGVLRLDIKIFTGEVTEKYLSFLRERSGKVRAGHTSLTIWPPTEPAWREVRSPL